MSRTRIKRDIDWFFETPPTGDPIEEDRPWQEDNFGVTIPVTGSINRMVLVEINWEDGSANPLLTLTLNGVAGNIFMQNAVTSGFSNGMVFAYWLESDIPSLGATPTLAATWTNGNPNEFQYASVVYRNVNQSNPVVDTNVDSAIGDMSFTETITTEDGGAAIVSDVSGNPSSSTVTTLDPPFIQVIDELDGVSQNSNVWQLLNTTAPDATYVFNINDSNRTLVMSASFRRA